jgi:hypothetical protein
MTLCIASWFRTLTGSSGCDVFLLLHIQDQRPKNIKDLSAVEEEKKLDSAKNFIALKGQNDVSDSNFFSGFNNTHTFQLG